MTIQQNYPAIKPSMSMDFANTKQLDPRITYSRASTGTYYDGKAIAKAEENLTLQSQAIATSPWTTNNATATNNTAVAPDGTMTAGTLTASATNNIHLVSNQFTTVANTTYTVSFFLKKGTNDFAYVSLSNYAAAGASITAVFDLNTGTVSQTSNGNQGVLLSSSITSSGGGWYRCVITGYLTLANASSALWVGLAPTASGNSFVSTGGISYSAAGTETIFVWGAQLEQRSFATAYTPTTTAPITNYIPVLQTASAGTPRFDHNPITGESLGLLIEEQRTNLVTYSEQFDNAAWTKTSTAVTSNSTVAPDGTTTADTLVGTGSYPFIQGSVTYTAAAYTFSVFVKKSTGTFALAFSAAGAIDEVAFNLATGATTTAGANITSSGYVDQGLYWRVWAVSTRTAVISQPRIFAGYPTNVSPVVWGAQLEVGAFPTSYIPTALTYSGRASTATFRAPNGLIQTAAVNAPRYEVNAGGGSNLLLENASSNLLTYTEDFESVWWTKAASSIAINTAVAPDGTFSADKMIETVSNGDHFIYQQQSVTWNSGSKVCFSVYLKAGERRYARVLTGGATAGWNAYCAFDLQTGVAGAPTANSATVSASISDVGNGWYRCVIVATPSVTSTTAATCHVSINNSIGANDTSYQGNGTSGIYVWGAQLESGSTATSYIPSLETFTGRTSTATYYDSTGIVRTAASGQPRYSYNPSLLSVAPKLLLEPQATNLLTYSEQFDNAAWIKGSSTIAANTTAAPDGTLTADTLTAAAANSFVYQVFSAAAATYTFSVWIKSVSVGTSLELNLYTNTGASSVGAAVVTTTGSWQRVSVTGVFASASASAWAAIGGNASFSTGETIYIWGAQLETGSGATSYIPTVASQVTRIADTSTSAAQSRAADVYSSSQVTRAADSAAITGTNFSSWYNPSEGTLYGEATSANIASENVVRFVVAAFDNIGYTNAVRLERLVGLARDVQTVNNISNSATVAWSANTSAKLAGTYANNNNAFAFNTTTSGFVFPVPYGINKLGIGGSGEGSNVWCGSIKKISYYPRRLTNTQIQALTT